MLHRMRKPKNSESGQALIMAVLVMLIVAVLAALFLAIIAAQLRQAQRQSFTVALQEIAEAGLRYADYNLVHGPEGADWRPDPNPGDFSYGDQGQFRLTVTYQPQAGDPYSRFIKLESLAKLKGNPFLQRRMVAYKPILVTDYVRFVANGEKNPLPAALGANVEMYLYEDPGLAWPDRTYPGRRYKTVLDGPIRVNTDLTWHGDVLVNLWSNRGDNVAVAGDISHDMVRQWNETSRTWDDPTSPLTEVQVSIDGGAPRTVLPSANPAFTALGGYYRDGLKQDDSAGDPRWVRYLDPPALDADRYLTLTRDSGVWTSGAAGTPYEGQQVNTGWFGYGKGIYIDNARHIIYAHDYEQMRGEWTTPDPACYPSWATAANYRPDVVRITFYPVPAGGLGVPAVELSWSNPNQAWEVWRDRDGTPIGSGSLFLPYPQDGVIYAAGDIAVSGTLPPAVGDPTRYYDQAAYDFDNLAGATDTNRYYHLTVVSGGNIYINGNLLSPVTAAVLDPDTGAPTEGPSDSKIALLARDSVVLNTTVLVEGQQVNVEGTSYYEVRPGRPLDVVVATATMDPVQIYLKHTGQPNIALPLGRAGAAIMQVLINGVPYDWNIGPLPVWDGSTNYFLFAPPPVASNNNETNAIYPVEESIPNADFGADKRVTFAPDAIGEPHVVRFQVSEDSLRFYWVRDIRARVDVEVDAAVYAEHGSWFIIPGTWPTEPEPAGGDPAYDPWAPPDPLPGEPLDVTIVVRGAISENRTAPLGDVSDWVAKWRGSDESWLPTSPNYDSDLGISKFTLRYLYDVSLRQALVTGAAGGPPRLPKLPVSPAMIAWGERI